MSELMLKAHVVGRADQPGQTRQPGQSQQLPEAAWVDAYDSGEAIAPPYDLYALAQLYETNAAHKACVDAKVTNTVGLGYRFVPTTGAQAFPPAPKGANRAHRALLEHLFDNCNPEMTFTEVLAAVWTDVECLGNGYLEITRNSLGEIDGFYHVPGTTMRLRGPGAPSGGTGVSPVSPSGAGYVQLRDAQRRYFRALGAPEERDPLTGEPENEVMHLKKYTPQSSYYGIPDIVAAMAAVVGDKEAREYNIDFFENHAVPRLAIIVEGGQLSDEVLAQIQEYMETEIRGQGHKTLVLDVPGNDVHIRLEPLTLGVSQDAAFLDYRQANRDEVLMVHRVPPSKITIVENANLANSQDQDKTFREQVIRPEQHRIEYRLNRLIREQMGVGDWRFEFLEMDLSEALQEAQIAQIYTQIGAWTPEEIRARQGLSAVTEP
jgi:PBSX family phage portal protein